jgi:hypothetical protein
MGIIILHRCLIGLDILQFESDFPTMICKKYKYFVIVIFLKIARAG